jgi:hypothetical protein
MNRRLGGDVSLNAPISNDGEAGEWQDWLTYRLLPRHQEPWPPA